PTGTRFALAGRTWETLEVNQKGKVIFVKLVPGVSTVDWDIDFNSELHTVLVRKMRSILLSDDDYPYLTDSCRERLAEIREIARNSSFLSDRVVKLSENKFAVFPWIGTRQLFTLHFLLLQKGIKSKIPWRTSVYLEVVFNGSVPDAKEALEEMIDGISSEEADPFSLPLPHKVQIENKYNEFIPPDLLKKQFLFDFLDFGGLKESLHNP
ncbi:MAG TPA: hypothetical protein VHR42_04315, partial [Clostridia bacterium]|nr:hypothetical protein [Clostridia bacterium]